MSDHGSRSGAAVAPLLAALGFVGSMFFVPVNLGAQSDAADVSVQKIGPVSVDAGDTVVFTLEVSNSGPAVARDVVLRDLLPSELRFLSASNNGSMEGREVGWLIPSLDVGVTRSFTVTAFASGRLEGRATVVNTAVVAASTVDPVTTNNASSVGVLVEGIAGIPDVEVVKSGPDSVLAGEPITYTVQVTNVGDRYTEDVVLQDVLPPGVSIVDINPAATNNAGVLTWPGVTELRPGETQIFTITVKAPDNAGVLTNLVTVTSSFDDANPDNDSSSVETIVYEAAASSDLGIEKSGPSAAQPGAIVSYTLTITNAGPNTAENVQVADSLPAGVRFLAGVPAPADTANRVVVWPVVPSLNPGEVLTYILDLEAPNAPATLVNIGTVTSSTPDDDPTNNVATATTVVAAQQGADLVVTKTPDGRVLDLTAPGPTVADTFRIVVTNRGPDVAASVVVVDTISDAFMFDAQAVIAAGGEVAGPVVTWRLGDIPADGERALAIPVVFDSAGTFGNTAHGSSATADPNPLNNADSAFVVVTSLPNLAQLSARKSVSRAEVEVGETVTYTVQVNWDAAQAEPVTLRDLLPRGFTYVTGTARVNGAAVADTARDVDGALLLPLGILALQDTAVVEYRVLVTAAAVGGDGINRAVAYTADVTSNEATARVRVLPGAFTTEGMIVGTVTTGPPGEYGVFGPNSVGIPGVRIFLHNGRFTHTDRDGKYSFVGLSPRTWVVRVDQTTLPQGSVLVPITNRHAGRGSSVFVDLKNGELHRGDFAEASGLAAVLAQVEERRAAPVASYTFTGPGYDVRTGDASRGPYQGIAPTSPAWDWEQNHRDPTEPDPGQVALEVAQAASEDSADAPALLGGALPELIAAGVVEGRFDLRSLLDGELSGLSERSRFEDALRTYSTTSDDGRRQLGARTSLFVDGEVGAGNRLTLLLDSEKDRRARFFNDIQPDEDFYQLFGDGSSTGFFAQSKGRLFGRWARGASFGQWGDFSTAGGAYGTSGARSLGEYARTLNGWLQHFETERVRIDAFVSRDRAAQVIDEFPGRGISGPYALSRAEGLLNSESVEIVTRDRNQPGVVLSTARLQRYADYTIEPFSGRIIFKRPVPQADEDFNPVTIRVTYEVESGADKYWVAGANAQARLGNRLEVGGGVVRDDNPLGRFDLASVNATLDLGGGTTLTSEYARSDSAATAAGGAYRFELRHGSDRFRTRLLFLQTDSLFANPSSPFVAARREFNFLGSARLRPGTSLLGEAIRTEARRNGERITGGRVAVDQRLGEWITGQLGFRYADVEPGSGSGADNTDKVQAVGARLTARLPGAPKGSVFGELEQDISFGDRRRAALGGDYRLFGRTRLYGRHEFIGSLRGPYDPRTLDSRNGTVFGVASDYGTGQSVFSEYRVSDALAGRQAQAAIGLRNRWEVRDGVRLSASAERLTPLSDGATTASALTGAFELTYDPRWKVAARAEYYAEGETDRLFGSLGLARKLNDDFTFLARSLFSTELGGGRAFERTQAGIAYRETSQNRVNLLGRYEHRYDRDPTTTGSESRSAHVLATHLNVALTPQLLVRGQWASQFTDASAVVSDGAQTAHLGGLRATLDVANGWDLGVIGRTRFGGGSNPTNFGLGAELGVVVACDLRLAGGYNAFGFRDPERLADDHTDRGFYIQFGFKFDESLFGFGDRDGSECGRVATPTGLRPGTVTPQPSLRADVAVGISERGRIAARGDSVDIQLELPVSNAGPDAATGVTLTAVIDVQGRAVDFASDTVVWQIEGGLARNGRLVYPLTVRAVCGPAVSVQARLRTTSVDPNLRNAAVTRSFATTGPPCGAGPRTDTTETTRTIGPPRLGIDLAGLNSTGPYLPGDTLTYVIRIRNQGASSVSGVRVRANVPPGLEFVPEAAAQGRGGGVLERPTRDGIAAGSGVADTFRIRAVRPGRYTVRVLASVLHEGEELITADSAQVVVGVPPRGRGPGARDPRPIGGGDPSPGGRGGDGTFAPADVDVEIDGTELEGYTATFRITTTNRGPGVAYDVVRRTTLPPGAQLLSPGPQPTVLGGRNLAWSALDSLAPGETARVDTFSASFPRPPDTLRVEARVTTVTSESDTTNNQGHVVVIIQDTINLPPCAGTCPVVDSAWWWPWIFLLLPLLLLVWWALTPTFSRWAYASRDGKDWGSARGWASLVPLFFGERGRRMKRLKAFALNREGRRDEAETLLLELIASEGWNAWNAGHLGRVYKDRFEASWRRDPTSAATADLLETAINTYRRGHEPGGAQAYPGLNALTLSEFLGEPPAWRDVLFAEVRDSLKNALDAGLENVSDGGVDLVKGKIHYWTHASLMELAVLVGDERTAESALAAALAQPHVTAQVETTLRNQHLIRTARAARGEAMPGWAEAIIVALEDRVPNKA